MERTRRGTSKMYPPKASHLMVSSLSGVGGSKSSRSSSSSCVVTWAIRESMNVSPPSPSLRTRSAAQGLTVRCRRSAAAMYANPVLPFDPEPVAGLVVVVLAVVAVLEAVLAAVFDTKVGHVQRRRLAVAVL